MLPVHSVTAFIVALYFFFMSLVQRISGWKICSGPRFGYGVRWVAEADELGTCLVWGTRAWPGHRLGGAGAASQGAVLLVLLH